MSRPIDDALRRLPAIAIIRHGRAERTAQLIDRLARGGITAAEVTTSTPGWLDLIAGATAGIAIGAGTVLTVSQVRDAHAAGASFIVSPGLDPDIVAETRRLGMEPLPGVLSPTEVGAALRAGAEWLKLFPAGPLGPDYLRALRGPFDSVRFVATGQIGVDDIAGWRDAGAAGVALGSELTGRASPASESDLDEAERRAAAVVVALAGASG